MPLKIYTNGSRHWGSQQPRIDDGFRALGHEVTPHISDVDLVYSNNGHAQVLADKAAGRLKPGVKVILTCLDVPVYNAVCDYAAMAAELRQADAVCTISEFGRWQVKHYLGLDSTVIWNPIKPVHCNPAHREQPFFRFVHVGRRYDPNKRFGLGVAALQLLGYTERDLCLVGNETGWGTYLGVLTDENLDTVYNSVDFVLCPSRIEGLLLPCIEVMAAGAVPVVCNDLSTLDELLPADLFPEYRTVDPTPGSVARFISRFVNSEYGADLVEFKQRLHAHYLANWRERTSPAGVADRILHVYKGIASL